ncbi:hypothetical protein [Rhizobium phage RHEph12]|nr:hypothetical protein [Rhizobium phage RHEph12]
MLNKPHESIAKNLEETLRYLSTSRPEHMLREYVRNVLFYLCGQARASSYEGWIAETVARVVKEEAAKRPVADDGTQLKTTADYLYEGMDAATIYGYKVVCDETPVEENATIKVGDTVIPIGVHDTGRHITGSEILTDPPLQQVEVTIPDVPLTLKELPQESRIDSYISLLAAVWPTMPDDLPNDEAEQWIEEQIERNMQSVSATATCREFETSDQTKKDGAIYDVIVQWRGDDGPIDEFVFNSRHSGIPVLTKKRAWQVALENEFAAWEQSATQDFIDYLKQHDGHGAVMAQPLAAYVKKRLQDTFDYKRICGENTIPSYQVEIGQESSHTFVNYTISIIVVEHNQAANQHLSFAMNMGEVYVALPLIHITGHHHGLKRAGSSADPASDFVAKMSHKAEVKVEKPKLFNKAMWRNQFGVLATVDGVAHVLDAKNVSVIGSTLYIKHLLTEDADQVRKITSITVIMFDDAREEKISILYSVGYSWDRYPQIDLSTEDDDKFKAAYMETAFEIDAATVINPNADNEADEAA